MKKRILSALLVFCLACSLVGTAWAADVLPTAAPTATPDASDVVTPDEPEDTTGQTEGEASDPAVQAEGETEPTAEPAATPVASATPDPSESPAPAATPDAEQPEATPTQVPEETETPTPSEEPEATPAPTAEAEGEPVDGGVEYKAELEQDGQALNVIVTAPEGAFDEGVNPTLRVSPIEDEAQTDGIAAKLDESGLTYDGFAALDIRFENEDGEEVEPNEGSSVKVRIELPDSIVDSGIDLSTLAVQHLAEDEAGNVTSVDPVASVADGTIALSEEAQAAMEQAAAEANAADGVAPMSNAPAANNALTDNADAAAVAEFEVSGFSTFTITWSAWFGATSTSVSVECYDATTGRPLPSSAKLGDFSLSNDETLNLTKNNHSDKVNIDGYTFDHADYEVGRNSQTLNSLKATYSISGWTYSCNGREVSGKPSIRLYYSEIKLPALDTIETVDSATNGVRISLFDYHQDNSSVTNYIGQQLGNFQWNGNGLDDWNNWDEGKGVVQGILNKTVDEETGLPTFVDNNHGNDFSWLFTESTDTYRGTEARTYYGNLNHLFSLDEYNKTGYYEYDSSKNFATLEENGDFKVYNQPYKPNDTQASTPKFLPLNDLKDNANTLDASENYYFGMKVGFDFIQPKDGMAEWNDTESPMRFDFTGDDDLWVFIDGVLVLDMGGVHDAQQGYIDFSTGNVWVSKVWDTHEQTRTLEEIFTEAKGADWVAENMTEGRFNDYSAHTFELYYMERGAGGSNCRMRFNIQSVPSGTVAVNKQVNSGASDEHKNAQYTMQLLVQDDNGNFVTPAQAIENYDNNRFTVGNSLNETNSDEPLQGDGRFTVTGNSTVYIHNIPADTVYKIVELNVDDETTVSINGETATVENGTAQTNESFTVGRNSAVTITNRFPVAPPDDFDITTGKRADLNNDGTYNLTLSTSGDIASVEGEAAKADIIFIIDRSSSMWNEYGGHGSMASQSRMQVLKNAIASAVDKIEENGIDARYAAVQFGMEAEYGNFWDPQTINFNQVIQDWTDNAATLKTTVNGISVDNRVESGWGGSYSGVGTNVQAGIRLANSELLNDSQNGPREGAKTFVILLSDGAASYSFNDNGEETDGGDHEQRAANEIKNTVCDYFYAIGVSNNYDEDFLNKLRDNVNATRSQTLKANNTEDLDDAFDELIQDMTFFAAENVVMHDTLSQWADVPNANDVKFTVKLEHREQVGDRDVWTEVEPVDNANKVVASGGSVHYKTNTTDDEGNPTTTDVYIIPTYEGSSKKIEVKLAANQAGSVMTYKLAPDYRYSVTLTIKPSDAAVAAGMGNDNAKQTPDDNTGTHAKVNPKEQGFWSNVNESAKVTYKVGEVDSEKAFPKPVIQVQETFGNLKLVKKVVDGSTAQATEISKPQVPGTDGKLVDAVYSFVIKAEGDLAEKVVANTDGYEISDSTEKVTFTKSGDDATATVTVTPGDNGVTIKDLPTGTYTITESNPAAEVTSGEQTYYHVSDDAGNGKLANVSGDTTAEVTITNTYKPYRTVIVTKQVGGDMGDTTAPFNFTTTVERDEQTATIGGTASTKLEDDFAFGVAPGAETVHAKLEDKESDATAAFTGTGYALASGESVTITKLKEGDTITVEETDYGKNGYETSYTVNGTTLSGKETSVTIDDGDFTDGNTVTVTVTNNRKVVAPTGLESNHTKPYALMVGAAGAAGLALIGAVVSRRIRRRREE